MYSELRINEYQPSEVTTVVKQYGPSGQNKRKHPLLLLIRIQINFNFNYLYEKINPSPASLLNVFPI